MTYIGVYTEMGSVDKKMFISVYKHDVAVARIIHHGTTYTYTAPRVINNM